MRFHCGLIWTGISLVLAGCSPLPGLVEIDQAPPERLAEIEQVLSRTLVQDPGNVGALIRLAKVNVRQGNGQAAVEYAGRAGHLKPFNASALILMGQGYQLMGRHIQAQEVLAQAVALEPARMEAYPYLARSQAQTGRSELALKTLDAALRRNPGFTLAWEAKAALLVEAAREKEAQAALNSALVLEPDSEVLQTIQVDLLIARGLLSLAAFMVEEALASHKESPLWLERLAALQRQRGEWSDLLSTLDQLQTVTLLEPRVLLWQEEALRHVNRHSEAQALLTRLQNTYGEFPPLRLRSAQRNMEAGDLKKALEDLDRYQELNPRNYASHLLKAALFFRLNRTPEGVQALERAVHLSPEEPNVLRMQSLHLLVQGDLKEAQRVLTTLFKDHPEDREGLMQQGVQLLRAGDLPGAKTVLDTLPEGDASERQRYARALEAHIAGTPARVLEVSAAPVLDPFLAWRMAFIRASALGALEKPKEGLTLVRPYLEYPGTGGLLHWLAGMLEWQGGNEKAGESLWEVGLAKYSRQPALVEALSRSALAGGKNARALELLQEGVKLEGPYKILFLQRMEEALVRLKRPREAAAVRKELQQDLSPLNVSVFVPPRLNPGLEGLYPANPLGNW